MSVPLWASLLPVWNSEQFSFWHTTSVIRFHNPDETADRVRRREAQEVLCDSEKVMSGAVLTMLVAQRFWFRKTRHLRPIPTRAVAAAAG